MIEPVVHEEVRDALAEGRPVVSLESTIFSNLGLPGPANRDALARCLAAVRTGGAVPAVTAVLDGVARVGLHGHEHERILSAARKVAERDLGVALAQRWAFGATTVSASLALSAAAGVTVFATGGIGGVHRAGSWKPAAGYTESCVQLSTSSFQSTDISADLPELAQTPIIVVCAGAKAILDLPATLEWLETHGVTVVGYGTDRFPAFYNRDSGLPVDVRADAPEEVVALFRAQRALGLPCGMLVAVPVPAEVELPVVEMEAAVERALGEAEAKNVKGKALTPFLLGRISELTGTASLVANLALLENNARVGAEIAVALAGKRDEGDR